MKKYFRQLNIILNQNQKNSFFYLTILMFLSMSLEILTLYSLLMLPVIIFPYWINFVGLTFLIPSLILTIYYNLLCYELYSFKKNKFNSKKAKSIFGYSILYLFLIFVLFLIDKIL